MIDRLPPPGMHGGDGAAIARAFGVGRTDLLDLSMSLNPFAPDLRPVLHRAVERGVHGAYPDESSALLALAGAIGVAPGRLVLTNGGSEAIEVVGAVLGRGWVDEPEFSLYRRAIPVLDPQGPLFRSNPRSPYANLRDARRGCRCLGRGLLPVGRRQMDARRLRSAIAVDRGRVTYEAARLSRPACRVRHLPR